MMFVIFPFIIRSSLRVLYAREALLLLVVPVFFAIMGVSAGKNVKKHWFLPLISLALLFVGEEVIMVKPWKLPLDTLGELMAVYLVLTVVFAFISAVFFRVSDKKAILKTSVIVSCIVNGVGFLINLAGYFIIGNIPFGITEWGGEYSGKRGFGLLLGRLHPMSSGEWAAPKSTTWLSFDPVSLVITLLIVVFVSVAFLSGISVMKNRASGKTD